MLQSGQRLREQTDQRAYNQSINPAFYRPETLQPYPGFDHLHQEKVELRLYRNESNGNWILKIKAKGKEFLRVSINELIKDSIVNVGEEFAVFCDLNIKYKTKIEIEKKKEKLNEQEKIDLIKSFTTFHSASIAFLGNNRYEIELNLGNRHTPSDVLVLAFTKTGEATTSASDVQQILTPQKR